MRNNPFPQVNRTEVKKEELEKYSSEEQFMSLSVKLMIEAGSYIVIASQTMSGSGTWSKNQSVIGGNVVRLYKIFSAILDQTCQKRREIVSILSRLAFETIVNTRFLIQEFSEDLVRSYIIHSLDHEYKLYKKIQKNINDRSGRVLPIEERMLKSINRAFYISGVEIKDMPQKKEKNWGGKNLYEKAKMIDIDEGYLAMFGGPSHDIHGSWMDISGNHLEFIEGNKFSPQADWGRPRPQTLIVLSLLSLQITIDFIGFIGGKDAVLFLESQLSDLEERLLLLDSCHEGYLSNKTWPEI